MAPLLTVSYQVLVILRRLNRQLLRHYYTPLEVLFYPMYPNSERALLSEISQTLPVRPSGKSNM